MLTRRSFLGNKNLPKLCSRQERSGMQLTKSLGQVFLYLGTKFAFCSGLCSITCLFFSVFAICCFSVLGDQQEDSTTRRSRPVRTYRRTRYYARHKWFLLLLFILNGPTNCQCYQYQVPNQKPLFGLQKTLLLQQWLQKMLSNKLNKEKRFGWLIKEVKLK